MSIIDEEDAKKAKPYEFSIAGFKLKLNSTFLAVAIPVLTTLGGASWGAFQFYTDYMNMKAKIEKYVAPDLTTFDKRLAVLEKSNQEQMGYVDDINTNLRTDVRRIDDAASDVARSSKEDQRVTSQQVRDLQNEIRSMRREVDTTLAEREREQKKELIDIRNDVDNKIKRAIDNPLANR